MLVVWHYKIMTSRNDITGDSLTSKPSNDAFRDGWDRIFGKKAEEKPVEPETKTEEKSDKPKKDKKWSALLVA